MMSFLKTFARDERGVTMPEYALMLLLVALACIGSVTFFGTKLSALFAQEAAVI